MYSGYATSQYLGLEAISLAFGTIVLMAFAHWGSLTSACIVCPRRMSFACQPDLKNAPFPWGEGSP